MSNEYLEWLNDLRDAPVGSKDHNHWLCILFPWLMIEKDNYNYTKLEFIPEGWRKAFGEDLCFEIKNLLEEADYEYDYEVIDIKEKFGELRWYDSGVPEVIEDRLEKVINKYKELSKITCMHCGKSASVRSKTSYLPLCDICKQEYWGTEFDIIS